MEEGSLFQRMKHLLKGEDELDEGAQKEAAGLIHNIIRYLDKDAKDIMTHRKHIVTIDGEVLLEDALRFMLQENFSRYPICRGGIDEIIGMIHLREAMSCYLDEKLRGIPLKDLTGYIRSAAFIPETKSIDTLFKEMQADQNHICIVVDEYGQTSGIVALEDIIEVIVGDILDEHDVEEKLIIKQFTGSYIMSGMADYEDVAKILDFPEDEEEDTYETLNGYLISKIDKIPEDNDKISIEENGYTFRVLKIENRIIQKVLVTKIPKSGTQPSSPHLASG